MLRRGYAELKHPVTRYYIDRTNHTTTQPLSKNAWMVKVLPTLLCLPGFETQTQNKERPVRGYILQKGEVHENRERDRGRVREQGGSENSRDLVCLKAL